MSLLTQLRKENLEAMKAKDTEKRSTLSLLISALALAEKEKKAPLTEAEEAVLLQKELKQTEETLSLTPADRPELISQSKNRIALIQSYLPKQMSDDEIREAVEKIMQAGGYEPVKRNQGKIMKDFMAQYRGKADGKHVSAVLNTLLS